MKQLFWKFLFVSWSFSIFAADLAEDSEVFLGDLEGVRLDHDEKGKPTLQGQIYRKSDYQRVHQFLKRHPDVMNRSKISPKARGQIREPDAEFHSTGGVQPTIFLELVLVEVKKSALEKLGMHLRSPIGVDTEFGFSVLQHPLKTLMVGTADPIRAFLDMAIQNGEARIHAKQSLVVQNGKLGEFHVGGEFPIKVVSGLIAKVEYKQYGLILKFTPHLARTPMIHLSLHSEISEIETGSLVEGIPLITKKDLKTEIFAKLDEMMAIGGMVRASQSNFTDAVPGLSTIPILGSLFESEDFKRLRSEAYIFITPKKMTSAWMPSPEL